MLSRPEKGSRGHIRLWLAGKDPNEKFDWSSADRCACGQYAYEHYPEQIAKHWLSFSNEAHTQALVDLNMLARDCAMEEGNRTFGRLYDSVCKAWAEEVA